ncbi:MAG: DUF2807 domain-containing protein [Victivallales bacterium]|nr:DUF2807 domain-containing protein [Victivallales bacterium]MCF7889038.1 DUF2807 domain-containing protein [Victivallales bacterium]
MKYRNGLLLAAFAVLLPLTFSTQAGTKEKTVPIKDKFNIIKLKANSTLHIKIGGKNELRIKADKKYINNINASVDESTLIISGKKHKKKSWDVANVITPKEKIKLHLTVKQLNKLFITCSGKVFIDSNITGDNFSISNFGTANINTKDIDVHSFQINILGSGDCKLGNIKAEEPVIITSLGNGFIKINKISAPQTNINITGNGSLTVEKIKTDKLKGNINGSGSVTIEGKAEVQMLNLVGTGNYNAEKLHTKNTYVETFGGKSIEIYATDTASINMYGRGTVTLAGRPENKKWNILGNGRIYIHEEY